MIANDRHDWGNTSQFVKTVMKLKLLHTKKLSFALKITSTEHQKEDFIWFFFKKQKQTMVGCYRSTFKKQPPIYSFKYRTINFSVSFDSNMSFSFSKSYIRIDDIFADCAETKISIDWLLFHHRLKSFNGLMKCWWNIGGHSFIMKC